MDRPAHEWQPALDPLVPALPDIGTLLLGGQYRFFYKSAPGPSNIATRSTGVF
jgi:hypothetical protein